MDAARDELFPPRVASPFEAAAGGVLELRLCGQPGPLPFAIGLGVLLGESGLRGGPASLCGKSPGHVNGASQRSYISARCALYAHHAPRIHTNRIPRDC